MEEKILKKLAELNVIFGAALNADVEWQKIFVKQEYMRIRTEIFELVRNSQNED